MRTRLFLVLAASLMFNVANGLSQIRPTGVRLGYLDPKGSQAGLILGLDLTTQVDETVELGVSINGFRRSYEKTTTIAQQVSAGGLIEKEVKQELAFTTFFLPIMAEAIVHFGQEDFHFLPMADWATNCCGTTKIIWRKKNASGATTAVLCGWLAAVFSSASAAVPPSSAKFFITTPPSSATRRKIRKACRSGVRLISPASAFAAVCDSDCGEFNSVSQFAPPFLIK